jgi:hypothetical protein
MLIENVIKKRCIAPSSKIPYLENGALHLANCTRFCVTKRAPRCGFHSNFSIYTKVKVVYGFKFE